MCARAEAPRFAGMVARTDPWRRVAHGVLVLLADAVLAGAALLAFVADAIGRQGFASSGVTAAQSRDWLIILAGWAAIMTAVAVTGLVRRRPEIAVLQAAVVVAVVVALGPAVMHGWRTSHPRPARPAPVTPYCPHGNCPGG
jgi:hypothetical protein